MNSRRATDYVLLGVLMVAPTHGYEIRQFLDNFLESKWHIGSSQMYSLLKRLETRQMVESFLSPQAKRPSKRIYCLTAQGKEAFLVWIQQPVMHVRDLRIEFIAKLFFIDRLSLSCGNRLIQNQIDALNRIKKTITNAQSSQCAPFETLSLRFRQTTIEACINWLKSDAVAFVGQIGAG